MSTRSGAKPSKEKMIQRIKQSPTYRRADQDLDILARDELRASRLQLEFLKPELTLEETGIHSTIVVLGGARIAEPKDAEKKVKKAQEALKRNPKDTALEHGLLIAKRLLAKSRYYDIARKLGGIVGHAGQGPEDCRLVIITGGGPGIMEAANRGAHEAGAKSIGLNIVLPHEQEPNPYVSPELCFQFRYFALRKMHFLHRAKALVVFPGGYGTLDELFDVLTLIQTRKVEPLPIVLVGEDFWRNVIDFQFLIDEGTIDPDDRNLFEYAETAQEIWDSIVAWYDREEKNLFSPPRKNES